LGNHKPYQGEVTGHRFNLSRIIDYRNNLLPRVQGEVRKNGHGSILEATLTARPVALVFTSLWLSAFLVSALAALATALHGRSQWTFLFPAGMFVFGYCLTQGSFWYEASRAKRLLQAVAASDSGTSG